MDREPFHQLGAWVDNDRMIMFGWTYPLIQLKSSTCLGVEPTHTAKKTVLVATDRQRLGLLFSNSRLIFLFIVLAWHKACVTAFTWGSRLESRNPLFSNWVPKSSDAEVLTLIPSASHSAAANRRPPSNWAPQASAQWSRWNYLISKKALIWSWGHSSRSYPSQPEFVYRSMCTDFHIAVKRDGICFCCNVRRVIYFPHVWWLLWTPTVRTHARTNTHKYKHTHTHYIFGCEC